MNTVVALMIVASTGVVEAPNHFDSLESCNAASIKIKKMDSYCVVKTPVDMKLEINKMMMVFEQMKKQMVKINDQN